MRARKAVRRRALRGDLLDRLSQEVRQFDAMPAHGLTAEEVAAVYDELGDQLYRMAVRCTPEGYDPDANA